MKYAWIKQDLIVIMRYRLYADGVETRLFVDRAKATMHQRVHGFPYSVHGSGMHPAGIALDLGVFLRLREAQAFAIKNHELYTQRNILETRLITD